jgi:acyl transferase domain-containing protein/acyl carrier protein
LADWRRFRGAYEALRRRPLVAELPGARDVAASAVAETPAFATVLRPLDHDQRRARIRDWIRGIVAHLLNTGVSDVDPAKGFFDHGFDSVMAAELRARVESELGVRLRSTAAFDHPSVDALAEHLLGLFVPGAVARAAMAPAAAVAAHDEPIAVVGMGCRFPAGANDPEAFWTLLANGTDAVGDVPKTRWDADRYYDSDPDAPGKAYTRAGAFLDRVDAFDAAFFGISGREARALDPRQRLLLEVSWEALERAQIVPATLANSRTGVFVGVEESEYGHDSLDLETLSAYTGLGRMVSTAAGRVSYVLGLQGPSLAVNTACSSSLVAVHLACQSLLSGECDLALAGGVALMLSPTSFVALSKARALSRDGRCKTFSASADGYGRGEGCGVVVLKRLSDALAAGDDIAVVIRGSAVAHDGRSSGLTVPNGLAQRRVLREALSRARLLPSDVQYVECHGTGTALGDPIEVEAVADVYAADRTRVRPMLLGAAKTNVGHLEAASGMVGLLKIALGLRHGAIPPTIHASELSTQIPWHELAVEVVTDLRPWTADGQTRRAGLSAFGISGTNAHLILEEPPTASHREVTPASRPERSRHIITLAARSDSALRAQARRLADHVASLDVDVRDVAHTLAATRTAFEYRLAFPAADRNSAVQKLTDFAGGNAAPALAAGRIAERAPTVAFLFPDHGSQYAGMATRLYETEPVFRAAIDRCDERLDGALAPGLQSAFQAGAIGNALDESSWAQPALFAVEYALTELWRSWGIEPDYLAGDGLGEYVAACVAGVLSLDDALRLAVARGRLTRMPQEMVLAVSVNEELARRATASAPPDFDIVARSVKFGSPAISLVSALDGQRSDDRLSRAEYWVEQVQARSRFDLCIRTLLEAGVTHFVEMGPDAALCARGAAFEAGAAASWQPSLCRGRDDYEVMFEALAHLWTSGRQVKWDRVDAPWPRRKVPLPTYAFDRESYWLEMPESRDRTFTNAADANFWSVVASGQAERMASLLSSNGALSDSARAALPDLVRALASYHASVHAEPLTPSRVYAPEWRRVQRRAADAALAGEWLLCCDKGEWPPAIERIVSALRRHGASVQLVTSSGAVAAALEKSRARGLVSAWSLASPEFAVGPVVATLQTLQAAATAAGSDTPRCWIVTSGAVSTGPNDAVTSPGGAALWGLGRAFALEHPQLWGGLLDVAGVNLDEAEIASVFAQLVEGDHLALRPDGPWTQRIVPYASRPRAAARAVSGTALVTGGLGALGLHVAKWLAPRGVERIVLASRHGLTSRGAEAAIESLGGSVMVVRADAGDRAAMADLLDRIASTGPPLRSVFHLAGVLDDGLLVNQTGKRLEAVLEPKAAGAWNLHQLTRDADLDAFVMFSSFAAALGSAGQTSYAAANAFLDGLAAFRRNQGLPALSIGWGPWAGDGMSARVAGRRVGLEPLDPVEALRILDELLGDSPAHAIVADVSWPTFRHAYESGGVRRLLADLPGAPSSSTDGALVGTLAGLSTAARTAAVLDCIRKQLAEILGAPSPDSIDPRKGFADMGLDSLMALELRARVRGALGVTLSATVAFDHPTLDRLARFVVCELFGPDETEPAAPDDSLARIASLKDEDAMQRIDEIIADLEG